MYSVGYRLDDAHLLSANSMTGQNLFDRSGDKLGVIKELFVNKLTGQIEFVLGATGGFLGVGEKFHPLPWSLLTFNPAPEGYVVAVGREDIRAAPAYDRDQLTSTSYGWGDQVHRYFAGLRAAPPPMRCRGRVRLGAPPPPLGQSRPRRGALHRDRVRRRIHLLGLEPPSFRLFAQPHLVAGVGDHVGQPVGLLRHRPAMLRTRHVSLLGPRHPNARMAAPAPT